jgi:asparagine synthase (glutamine-hydrolysing)
MSIQFGKCNFDGRPVDPEDLAEVRPVLAPYGPDGEGFICKDNFALLYRAFYTTRESRMEVQPYVLQSGDILTWDGRLDNREELISELDWHRPMASTDLEIVAESYERWGTNSFSKFIGDWSLSIWNPRCRSLLLAKDFLGTRHLYYSINGHQVTWCTVLDPLVLFARHSFELSEEYLAGWITAFPSTELTPYVGIRSVPSSSYVQFRRDSVRTVRYWNFDPSLRIRYSKDEEYEEHFRVAFFEAVRRRLRCDGSILAELSGGMDSSSIVCAADRLAGNAIVTQTVDTVSYYDDSEPNWNERPYFSKVEQQRGRTGVHLDVSAQSRGYALDGTGFLSTPSSVKSLGRANTAFSDCLVSHGYRVLLSGVGGDEVTGGVPTPGPELQDLIVSLRLRRLAHQLKMWALAQRRPWIHVLWGAMRSFLLAADDYSTRKQITSWLHPCFARHNAKPLRGYVDHINLFEGLPSFQQDLHTLDGLRRQLTCTPMPSDPACEIRYPYLDRNLLEFLYAVPREQLVRPGQRRSLMRRALVGIVPDEILNRRRKAFVTRSAAAVIFDQWNALLTQNSNFITVESGIVRPMCLEEAVGQLRSGQEVPIVTLMRIFACESWLRSARKFLAITRTDLPPFTSRCGRHKPVARTDIQLAEAPPIQKKGGERHEVCKA